MRFKTIESGSKGNCSIVITEHSKIIIDMGISYLKLKKSLEEKGLSFSDFSGILLTHCHNDHIKGLASLLKNTKLKVYIPKEMFKELNQFVCKEDICFLDDITNFSNLVVEYFTTSHDTDYSYGYIITSNNKSIVYVTDTGYINRKYFRKLKGKNLYLIESNHDENMLMNGPYPYYLKQRVLSDRGHLSNKTTATYLKKLVDENTKNIILAHLSEKNNTEQLALDSVLSVIKESKYDDINVFVARQTEESPFIEV